MAILIEEGKEGEERLSKFAIAWLWLGLRLNMKSLCKFLAWNGMVKAGFWIITLTIFLFDLLIEGRDQTADDFLIRGNQTTNDLSIGREEKGKEDDNLVIIIIISTLLLIFNILFFYLNLQFKRTRYQSAQNKQIVYYLSVCEVMMAMIVILYFIMDICGLNPENFILFMVLLLLPGVSEERGHDYFKFLLIVSTLHLIMTSLKIHGVRTNKKNFIRAYIVYIYVLLAILILWIVIHGILEKDTKVIFSSFGCALSLFYQFLTFAGYTIVADSIILIKEKEFDQIQEELGRAISSSWLTME